MKRPKEAHDIKQLLPENPIMKKILKQNQDLEFKDSYYEGHFSDDFITTINNDLVEVSSKVQCSTPAKVSSAIYRICYEVIRGEYHLVLRAILNFKSYKANFVFTFALDCKTIFPINSESVDKYLTFDAMQAIRWNVGKFCSNIVGGQ